MRPLILLLSLIFSLSFSQIQAQSPKLIQALKVKVLSKNVNKTTAKYKLAYQKMNLAVQLKKEGSAVIMEISSKKGMMIGKAKISPTKAGSMQMQVLKSKGGLAALWIFGYSTLHVNKGNIVLAYRGDNSRKYEECQYCCYLAHLQQYTAASDAYVRKQIAKGKPPKEWGVIRYIPTESYSEFYDCVQDCMSTLGSECN